MTGSQLEITAEMVGEAALGWRVVRVAGELDLATVEVFREQLGREVAARAAPRLVLDLDGLTFVDSTGLGALVDIFKRVHAAAGELVLAAAPDQCGQMLARTGLDRLFTLAPDVATATASS